MSNKQHVTPLWIADSGATPLTLLGVAGTVNEAEIPALIQQYPSCLPIAEIDPVFVNPVPVCTELKTEAGSIDNLFVTPSGLGSGPGRNWWRCPTG